MKFFKQISIILAICLVADGITMLFSIPIPASVVSIVLMAVLLIFNIVKEKQIKDTADFLLSNMAIVFLPLSVAVIEELGILKGNIITVIIICVISLICTFFSAYFSVCIVEKLINRIRRETDE
ncbi:MAG: CidA/LrgA family protein [Suipraeoptans sp.]